jgi:hypothetical protein
MPPKRTLQEEQAKRGAAVEPYLAPGERAVAVFFAQRPNPWLWLTIIAYLIIMRSYYLVVTDQGVVVVEVNTYKSTPKRFVSRESHTSVQLGRVMPPGFVKARVADKSYWISYDRSRSDLFAAARDALANGAGSPSVT